MDRLSNLRERLQEKKELIPFPLSSLLYLYHVSNKRDTYCDSFAGMKLLIKWLGPEFKREVPTKEFIEFFKSNETWIVNFESQSLAHLLNISIEEFIYHAIRK